MYKVLHVRIYIYVPEYLHLGLIKVYEESLDPA